MSLPDLNLSVGDLLRTFHHEELYLFLGAAITTIGLLAAAFSLFRRRPDPLLLWFALFAILYGASMWKTNQLLDLPSDSPTFDRIRVAFGFLVPVPAFFFLRALEFLSRLAKYVAYTVTPVSLTLTLATLVFGPLRICHTVNNAVVTAALFVFVFSLLRPDAKSPDTILIRVGLFAFIVTALYENIFGVFGPTYSLEPFGFVVLLACLGTVAARRTLAQEHQLTVIQKELEIAKRIQLSILPAAFPASTSFEVAARYLPMTSVAGDFYDFPLATDTEAGLLIADVSGHGVPAALIASMVKLAATSQRGNAAHPSDLLLGMNTALCGNTQNQFVTAAYVYLNASTRELSYSAAAHPPMLLLRRDTVSEVVENGLMLAAFPSATFQTATRPIERGDRLLLYTDGLVEAANATDEEYGPERLHHLLRETSTLPPTEAVDRIISSIQQWSAVQNDDLTVVLCDVVA